MNKIKCGKCETYKDDCDTCLENLDWVQKQIVSCSGPLGLQRLEYENHHFNTTKNKLEQEIAALKTTIEDWQKTWDKYTLSNAAKNDEIAALKAELDIRVATRADAARLETENAAILRELEVLQYKAVDLEQTNKMLRDALEKIRLCDDTAEQSLIAAKALEET